jgi:GR25 family glycosyltransferase involved in LPS biosynthesis
MIEKTYCINLDRRPERWEAAKIQMAAFGVDAERYPAIDGQILDLDVSPIIKAQIACSFSHFNLLEKAYKEVTDNVLILEDDVVFCDDARHLFERGYPIIPLDWDIVFLGANHGAGFAPVNESFIKCNGSLSLHACMYNKKALPKILDHLHKEYPSMNEDITVLDVVLSRLHKTWNVYSFSPSLAYQKEGFSDILQKHVSYPYLK